MRSHVGTKLRAVEAEQAVGIFGEVALGVEAASAPSAVANSPFEQGRRQRRRGAPDCDCLPRRPRSRHRPAGHSPPPGRCARQRRRRHGGRRVSRHSGRRDHQRARRQAARRRRRAQRLAAGDRSDRLVELGGVASHDGDVVAVAADEDMRRAGAAAGVRSGRSGCRSGPERVDEDRLQARLLGGERARFRQDRGRRSCRRRRWRRARPARAATEACRRPRALRRRAAPAGRRSQPVWLRGRSGCRCARRA